MMSRHRSQILLVTMREHDVSSLLPGTVGYQNRTWFLVIDTWHCWLPEQGMVSRHCYLVLLVTGTGHDVSSLLPGIVGYHDRE
jgi:hypothetical protein